MPSSARHAALPQPPSLPTRRSSDLRHVRAGATLHARRADPVAAVVVGRALVRARRWLLQTGRAEYGRWRGGGLALAKGPNAPRDAVDRKSTRLNSSHSSISYAVFRPTRRAPTTTLSPYTTLFRS